MHAWSHESIDGLWNFLQAPVSRRRMSLGMAPPAEDGHVRDPEELVEDDQELVR